MTDLHISSPDYIPEWGERAIKNINSMKPDILVITGDLTMDGYVHEFEFAGEYIKKFKVEKIIIVPGNHDARNEGYKIFEEIFETRYPIFENDEVVIVGVDSTEPDIDDGHVGRDHYYLIRDELSLRDKTTFFVLHHHLIPIPGTGRERHIASDAGDVLQVLTESKVNFVLSGHKHKPWIWKLDETYFITTGTATTRRLMGKSYPSFNILNLEDKKATLMEFNVEDEVLNELKKIRIIK
jgi:3',5'-cyclic AMP phosphodiesterase CpdA